MAGKLEDQEILDKIINSDVGTSDVNQHRIEEILDEVICKVVEDAKAKGGSCQVTRTEAEHEGNKKEDLSVSVAAQVLFHLYNIIKYLVYFWFVRYYVFEISHIFNIHEI